MVDQTEAQGLEGNAIFKDAVDKHHFFVSRLAGGLGLAGNGSGEHPGEELKKTCGHKKIKFQKLQTQIYEIQFRLELFATGPPSLTSPSELIRAEKGHIK
jgi:hypothetical protein